MDVKKIPILIIALLIIFTFSACGNVKKYTYDQKSAPKATDYSKAVHWLSLPAAIDKKVDVFYLYPTSWLRVGKDDPIICEIDNPMMLKYAKHALARQASAFESIGNIFAPYYRQDDALYTTSLPAEEQLKIVGSLPKSDAFAAFDYYMKNYNNGRPFILAGHSQGSIVLTMLLSEYMKENPKVYGRMIAAYIIGASITSEYLAQNPHLKFAEGPDDIGVIISYNTEAPVVEGKSPVLLPGAIAINPITWTRTEKAATAAENLGSVMINKDGSVVLNNEGKMVPVKNYADAKVDKARGVVICSTADVEKLAPGNALSGKGVFHSFDYSFYYFNIKDNAANRTKKFLSK